MQFHFQRYGNVLRYSKVKAEQPMISCGAVCAEIPGTPSNRPGGSSGRPPKIPFSRHDPVRQEGREPQDAGRQEKDDQHRRPEEQHRRRAFLHRGLPHRAADEKPGPDRRRGETDRQVDNHQQGVSWQRGRYRQSVSCSSCKNATIDLSFLNHRALSALYPFGRIANKSVGY